MLRWSASVGAGRTLECGAPHSVGRVKGDLGSHSVREPVSYGFGRGPVVGSGAASALTRLTLHTGQFALLGTIRMSCQTRRESFHWRCRPCRWCRPNSNCWRSARPCCRCCHCPRLRPDSGRPPPRYQTALRCSINTLQSAFPARARAAPRRI